MSYTLQAFVAPKERLQELAESGGSIVELSQSFGLVPVDESFCARHRIEWLALLEGDPNTESLRTLGASVSNLGPIAYIEAMFFGGDGTQASWIFDGPPSSAHVVGKDAINQALKQLGVVCGEAFDEFDALGLGEHRNTSDWVRTRT